MPSSIKNSHSFFQSPAFYYGMLFIWFVVNLLQSSFTELLHDEAYYFIYAQELAWGYYDHPPAIALLIKLGTFMFNDELGVRFFISLMSVGTIVLIVKMAKVKNYLFFFALLFSIFIIHAGGFIAVPDIPLIFFTTLFFYFYRNYLDRNSWVDVLLVSFAIAAALYSKYLGILVVVFAFASNPSLLRRKTFWAVVVLSALAMIPHLIWQIQYDYSTLYFHLVERSRNTYFTWMHPVNYLLGQLLLLNPLLAFFLLYFALKEPTKNLFTKALKYSVYGILVFGLLLSFLGPVEANWTVAAYIPIIVLAYPHIEERVKLHKVIYILSSISILLILVIRVYLAYDFITPKTELSLQKEFHGWDIWAKEMEKVAGDRPVVFASSYQKPAKYIYYSGNESFTFNYIRYRRNQFDLNKTEIDLMDRAVVFFSNEPVTRLSKEVIYPLARVDSVQMMGSWWYYSSIDYYRSYNFIPIEVNLGEIKFSPAQSINIPIELINPLDEPISLKQTEGDTWLSVSFVQNGTVMSYQEIEDISNMTINKNYQTVLQAKVPEIPGKYNLWVSIRTGWLPPGLNSRLITVEVTKD